MVSLSPNKLRMSWSILKVHEFHPPTLFQLTGQISHENTNSPGMFLVNSSAKAKAKYFFLLFWKILNWAYTKPDFNGLVQDCSISSALAMEILQSCTKLSIYSLRQSLTICVTAKGRMACTRMATSNICEAISWPWCVPSIRVSSTNTLTYLRYKDNYTHNRHRQYIIM